MKTKLLISSFMCFLFASSFAQNKTTVNATSSEISDNLDLRAVASIFGDSKDLSDFEFRLNDPKEQISNLDLNNDNQVDYLRVIESIEGNVHLIVIQAVLGHNQFQDVATVEVEKDINNRMQIQIVGDVYMYGRNYIYEPVYVNVPFIYNYFWVSNYNPYYSSWNWGYYPAYYYCWNPYPLFRYRHNIVNYINFNYQYNYVRTRRCETAYNNYYGRRSNYYERENPNRSFEIRNFGYSNRYDLDQSRPERTLYNGNNPRNTDNNPRIASVNPRNYSNNSPRLSEPRLKNENLPRNKSTEMPRNNTYESPRNSGNATPRASEPRNNGNSNPSQRNNDSGERNNSGGRDNGGSGRSFGGARR
ncbi:hypothetical protein [Flavobacterium sp.]|uniref:hypothetical protein n=1 Tax=Flavobacterium sp. TaxID=239 RepID=UPI003BDD3442